MSSSIIQTEQAKLFYTAKYYFKFEVINLEIQCSFIFLAPFGVERSFMCYVISWISETPFLRSASVEPSAWFKCRRFGSSLIFLRQSQLPCVSRSNFNRCFFLQFEILFLLKNLMTVLLSWQFVVLTAKPDIVSSISSQHKLLCAYVQKVLCLVLTYP